VASSGAISLFRGLQINSSASRPYLLRMPRLVFSFFPFPYLVIAYPSIVRQLLSHRPRSFLAFSVVSSLPRFFVPLSGTFNTMPVRFLFFSPFFSFLLVLCFSIQPSRQVIVQVPSYCLSFFLTRSIDQADALFSTTILWAIFSYSFPSFLSSSLIRETLGRGPSVRIENVHES